MVLIRLTIPFLNLVHLIDELQLTMFPYVAGEGTRLFDGVPRSYQLDLVSSAASPNGVIELRYLRHR